MSEWLSNLPVNWHIAEPRRHFRDRREVARSDDAHLTPSQHMGVLTQAEYMERTGSRVVLNLSAPDNMKHVEPGDFIAHLRSFQGGLERSGLRGKVSTAYTVIAPDDSVHGPFYRWVLKSAAFISALSASLEQLRDGQSVKFEDFAAIPLPLPPISEQRRIADFLDDRVARIDQIASARQAQTVLVDEMAKAHYQGMLHRASNGQVVEVRRLLKRAPDYGLLPDSVSDDPTGPRYVRTTDITEEGDLREDSFVSVDPAYLADYGLAKGDVVVARSGNTIGKALVYRDSSAAVFAGYLVRMRFSSIDPWAFWYFTKTNGFSEQLWSNAVQSTIPNFNADRYSSLAIPDVRSANATLVESLHKVRREAAEMRLTLDRSVRLLTAYKQSLITAAVTGDLDVTTAGSGIPG